MTRPDEIAALADGLYLGQLVEVSSNYKYAGEWRGEYRITELRWRYQEGIGRCSVSIASEEEIEKRYGDTSDFSPNDLVPIERLSATPGDAMRERDALNDIGMFFRVLRRSSGALLHGYTLEVTRADYDKARAGYDVLKAALAPAEKAGKWYTPVETVADLIGNLRRLDPALNVHGAYHINVEQDRCRARALSMSLERVSGNRVRNGDETIPYSLVIWTQPDAAATPTPPSADVALFKEAAIAICLEEAAEWDSDNVQTLKNYAGQCANRISNLHLIQSAAHGGGMKSDVGVEGHAEEKRPVIGGIQCLGTEANPLVSHQAGVEPGPSDPAQEPEAVAFVPVHPKQGPLWTETYPADRDVSQSRSQRYERMALYTRPVSLDREAVARSTSFLIRQFIAEQVESTDYGTRFSGDALNKVVQDILALIEGRT